MTAKKKEEERQRERKKGRDVMGREGEVHGPGDPAPVQTDIWHPALTEEHLKGKDHFFHFFFSCFCSIRLRSSSKQASSVVRLCVRRTGSSCALPQPPCCLLI